MHYTYTSNSCIAFHNVSPPPCTQTHQHQSTAMRVHVSCVRLHTTQKYIYTSMHTQQYIPTLDKTTTTIMQQRIYVPRYHHHTHEITTMAFAHHHGLYSPPWPLPTPPHNLLPTHHLNYNIIILYYIYIIIIISDNVWKWC